MPQIQLLLASGSPQRKRLLSDAGYSFEIVVPNDSAECGICSSGGPAALVVELAQRKAADVLEQMAERGQKIDASCILIACDTVAECDGAVLGKPRDEEHARSMLERLRGNVHRVYSGLCVGACSGSSLETRLAVTELRMDSISDRQLDDYLASGLWRGKAGAFGYQDRVGWLHILEGSESNVVGLPMELLREMLSNAEFGLRNSE
ncbi:MAG: septum formation protein Maf [Planctomycetes bacterium]|nr:septum formation protein Maf [Planctomycetota bacterium]